MECPVTNPDCCVLCLCVSYHNHCYSITHYINKITSPYLSDSSNIFLTPFDLANSVKTLLINRGVWKTEIWFRFRYKKSEPNPNHPKNWHLCRWFSDRNCVQSTVQIKSDNNNLNCIQCADKERFKTRLKPSLAYGMHSSFNTAQ